MSTTKIHTLGALSPSALPRKRALWKRVLKVLDRVLAVLVVLIAIVCLFLQTGWFRDVLISEIESIIEKETNGKISIESIGGNFLSGFTLNNVHLKLRNPSDTADILSVDQIYIRYNVLDLIAGKGIPIKEVKLRSPIINLTRELGDSVWNLDKLFVKSEPKPNDTSKFSMLINLRTVRLENATMRVRDKTDTSVKAKAIAKDIYPVNWSDMYLTGVDIDLSASIDGEDKQYVRVNHISFREEKSDFNLHRLSLVARRDKDIVSLDSMILVTDHSTIGLAVSMDPLTVLSGAPYDSMGRAITSLDLQAKAVNTAELRQLLPMLDFLGGTPGLSIVAKGEYGKLVIKKGGLELRTQGKVAFKGSILNLHKPEKIFFDLDLEGKHLSDATLRTYIPGIPVNDLKQYGDITIKKVTFKGTPDNFASDLDLETSAGFVKGRAGLDFRGKDPLFDVDLTSNKVNLGAILGDTSLASDLNVVLKMKGKSFDPKYSNADFVITTSAPTRLGKYGVTDLSTSGTLRNGVLTTRNTKINITGGGSISSDYAIFDLNSEKLKYDVDLTATDIPLSQYVAAFPKEVKATLTTSMSGEGLSLDAMEGSLKSKIKGVKYKDETLPDISLNAFFKRNPDGTRSDNINSDIADMSFEGKYAFDKVSSTLVEHINAGLKALSKSKADTLRKVQNVDTNTSNKMNMKYSVDLKDLRALYMFMPEKVLLGEGKISGEVTESHGGALGLTADGNIYQFLFKNRATLKDPKAGESGVNIRVFDTTTFQLSLTDMTKDEDHLLDSLLASLVVKSDSTIRVSGAMIHKPEVSVSAQKHGLDYSVSSGVNDFVGVYLKGRGTYSNDGATFPIDTIALDFGNNFVWQTESKPTVTLDTFGRIALDTLAFYRPDLGYDPENLLAQRVKFGIDMTTDSIRHAFIDAPQLKLKELPMFFSRGIRQEQYSSVVGRITRMHGELSGALANPKGSIDLLVRNFNFNDVTFDSTLIQATLADHTLKGMSIFRVDTGKFAIDSRRAGKEILALPYDNKFLLVLDSFPINISLSPGDTSEKAKYLRSRRGFSLHATAEGYPLDFFGPFIPLVKDVHGLANAEIRAFGDIDSIQLDGKALITNSTMTIANTNVPYRINGKLSLDENEIRFDSINIENLPEDDPSGRAFATGKLEMKGLTPGGFDFTMKTNRLTVMTDATKDVLKNIYGPLAIRSGVRPIHFYGNLNEPHLDGDLTIVQGFLTLPQNTSASAANSGDIIYRTIYPDDDSTGEVVEVVDTMPKNLTIYDIEDNPSLSVMPKKPTLKEQRNLVADARTELSFMDKMLYDLDIAIPGDLWINIFFARGKGLLGEQLSAELQTDRNLTLKRTRAGTPLNFRGDLNVTDRSSYKFIRDFNPVYGTISFINDISNPLLNIKAEYGAYNSIKTSEYYKILLKITGTANDPKLDMEIYKRIESSRQFVLDEQHKGDQAMADGLYFLTTNAFQTDLTQTESANVASQLATTIPSALANSMLNGFIGSSDLKNYLRNVSLDYRGSAEPTGLKLTAGYKDITFQYGAQDLSNPSAADYTVEVPASAFAKFNNSKNIIFQFTAHTYSLSSSTTSVINQPNFEAVVMYRFQIPGHSLSLW
ncbi:MAG TPA: translocation/assembly module TamB domain-containing protein [Candidatus Kapabacteria bacterium]